MIGRFVGAVLLQWVSPKKVFVFTALLSLISVIILVFSPFLMLAKMLIFMIGLGFANLFPLIFAITVNKMPARVNEISGLMIMAVAGGAFIPPVMGVVSSAVGVPASFLVLVAVMVYVLFISLFNLRMNQQNIKK